MSKWQERLDDSKNTIYWLNGTTIEPFTHENTTKWRIKVNAATTRGFSSVHEAQSFHQQCDFIAEMIRNTWIASGTKQKITWETAHTICRTLTDEDQERLVCEYIVGLEQ